MQCPSCNADNPAGARQCGGCGGKLPRRSGNHPGVGESAIRSWMESPNATARLAYQCSLWAMIPFLGLVLGPAAVLLGITARWYERAQPSTRGSAQARAAIVIGALTLLTNWAGLYFLLRGL